MTWHISFNSWERKHDPINFQQGLTGKRHAVSANINIPPLDQKVLQYVGLFKQDLPCDNDAQRRRPEER